MLPGLIQEVALGTEPCQRPPMTLYHLNFYDSAVEAEDEEGEDLPDLDAARDKATKGIQSFLAHELMTTGEMNLDGRIEVVDASGAIVLTIPFAEAVHIIGGAPARS